MKDKILILKVVYWLPIAIACLRVIVTFIVWIWNPTLLSLRLLQVLPFVFLLIDLFRYVKLFNDGDPIISLLLPSIVHLVIILVFKKKFEIVAILPILFCDILYLVVKGVKGSFFPFVIEGEEDELEAFTELEDMERDMS